MMAGCPMPFPQRLYLVDCQKPEMISREGRKVSMTAALWCLAGTSGAQQGAFLAQVKTGPKSRLCCPPAPARFLSAVQGAPFL